MNMLSRPRRHYGLSWPRFRANATVRFVKDLLGPNPSEYAEGYTLAFLEAEAGRPDLLAMDVLLAEARALSSC